MMPRRTFMKSLLAASTAVTWNTSLKGIPGSAAAQPLEAAWQQWGGPNRDFALPDDVATSRDLPELRWRKSIGPGHAAVVCDSQWLYTAHANDDSEVIEKRKLDDGELIWSSRYDVSYRAPSADYDGPHATPLLTGNLLVVVSIDAIARAFDCVEGTEVWACDLRRLSDMKLPQSGYAASPLLWNNAVILPTLGTSTPEETETFDPAVLSANESSRIPGAVGVDLTTGRELWRSGPFRLRHSSPILVEIDGQTTVVFHGMFELVGVEPANGRIQWRQLLRRQAADNVSFTPLWDVARQQILIAHGYCTSGAQAIGIQRSGAEWQTEIRWTNSSLRPVHTNGVLCNDMLIATNRSPSTLLVGVKALDGRTMFRQRGFGKSNFIVPDKGLLILNERGSLSAGAVDSPGFRERWRINALDRNAWTVPSVAGDLLLLRDSQHVCVYEFASD